MHHAADLTAIAIVAVAATLCGVLFVRLRQPAIVGYIVAGVILGPSGLQLVQNREAISFFAELGVILLLYFIGMELSLRSFRQIWRVAIVTALAQIAVSLGLTWSIAQYFDWPLSHTVLFGFCLALSSTAVAVKILDDIGALRQQSGRLAIGVLIAQDLAVAPMLIFVTSFAGDGFSPFVFVEVAVSIALLLGVILIMTRRQRVNLPFHRILEAQKEISTIGSITMCFGAATLAGVIGLSPAFGAFIAGLIVGNSGQRQVLHENAEPVQAVLLMIFFLSIGLLIDIGFLIDNIGLVLLILLFVTIFKTALNILVLRAQGVTMQNAFLASLVIAQLGEFSFVLAGAASEVAVIDSDVYRLIVAVTVLSLMTSPLVVNLARRGSHRSLRHSKTFGRMMRLIYRDEWRFTRATSLWFWLITRDALKWTSSITRNWSLSSRSRLEALKLAHETNRRAKASAKRGLQRSEGAKHTARDRAAQDAEDANADDAVAAGQPPPGDVVMTSAGDPSTATAPDGRDGASDKQPGRFSGLFSGRRKRPSPGV